MPSEYSPQSLPWNKVTQALKGFEQFVWAPPPTCLSRGKMAEEFEVKCIDEFMEKSVEFAGNFLKKEGLEKLFRIFESRFI